MKKPPFVRSLYNYDAEAASNEAAIPADKQGESLTVQSMTEDADINVLMQRFGITGVMPQNPRVPSYGDYSGITDFRSALEAVRAGQDAFGELPASVRAQFDNDPQLYLEFCANPDNIKEMVAMGLAKEKEGFNADGTEVRKVVVDRRGGPGVESVDQGQRQFDGGGGRSSAADGGRARGDGGDLSRNVADAGGAAAR